MCGIVGFTTKDWHPDQERIRDATNTLIHRGPDQQGVFRSRTCSLGATRLKIVDLASGDQPIFSEDRDSVIVFNGEIYNHLEVRRELESLGHRFQTHCDTETVLQAFLEWDTNCFERLRGMFAVAVWSNSKQRLVLARDRIGIKPLYIAERGEDLFFASELKGILVHPEIERRLHRPGTLDNKRSAAIDFFGAMIRADYRDSRHRRVSPRALSRSRVSWRPSVKVTVTRAGLSRGTWALRAGSSRTCTR